MRKFIINNTSEVIDRTDVMKMRQKGTITGDYPNSFFADQFKR